MQPHYPWLAFALLYTLGLIGAAAVLPFTSRLIRPKPQARHLALQFLQTSIFLGIFTGFGLRAAMSTGLTVATVHTWKDGVPDGLFAAAIIGVIAAAIACVVDYFFLLPKVPELKMASKPLLDLPLRYRILAALYGGFTEELIMHLGIFSLLAWAVRAIAHRLPVTLAMLWSINIFVALLFAASHLPAAAALTPLTTMMVVRTLVINGALGVIFGYVYLNHGLEAAIVCHLAADVILQLAGRLAGALSPDV
jgi:hypothetical protein